MKYETGKLSVFYAGCVLNCEETSIRVNFMRKVGDYCSFVYPDTEDIHEVGYESVVLILGAPIQNLLQSQPQTVQPAVDANIE